MSHLNSLYLKNFILIKETTIHFREGFHVISGETGSGKTMILQALSLILGDKADPSIIRKGADKALIAATFSISKDSPIHEHLKTLDIDCLAPSAVTISREITGSKNKVFIENAPASVADIKSIAPYLAEIIHSHAQLSLQDPFHQKAIVDTYGENKELIMNHEQLFSEQHKLFADKEKLLNTQKEGLIYAKLWEEILAEISSLEITSLEKEAACFAKYTQLSDQQGSYELSKKLLAELSESPGSITQRLTRMHKDLTKITSIQLRPGQLESYLTEALAQLEELSFKLSSAFDGVDSSALELEKLEKELQKVKLIKKKYGPTFEDIENYKRNLQEKLEQFNSLDMHLADLEKQLKAITEKKDLIAKRITQKRTQAAQDLEKSFFSHLPSLNLSGSIFTIEVTPTLPSSDGADAVCFYFQTEGSLEKKALSTHASSGELARIFFILKLLLQTKNRSKLLVFDEIDANIGGVTASMFGKLLKELGKKQQVLAISHFAQVAHHADHHLHVEKVNSQNDVSSLISLLDQATKKKELHRMVGGICLDHLSDT